MASTRRQRSCTTTGATAAAVCRFSRALRSAPADSRRAPHCQAAQAVACATAAGRRCSRAARCSPSWMREQLGPHRRPCSGWETSLVFAAARPTLLRGLRPRRVLRPRRHRLHRRSVAQRTLRRTSDRRRAPLLPSRRMWSRTSSRNQATSQTTTTPRTTCLAQFMATRVRHSAPR